MLRIGNTMGSLGKQGRERGEVGGNVIVFNMDCSMV